MNILTFDIEDWFHILNYDNTSDPKQWGNYECRINHNFNYIIEILEKSNVKATFFVLGWIAKKYPNIVKQIVDMGYEIGSHTYSHQLIYKQDKKEFYNDVERSIKTLEDISGNKVSMFRAPGFSIKKDSLWAYETLYDLGIRIDSSVFPSKREHGGMPEFIFDKPCIIEYNGLKIKEFPINKASFFGFPIVFSGGGYFRICPYFFIDYFSKRSKYIMTYFHPRDFDPDQPVLDNLGLIKKYKTYVGLKSCYHKLDKWINNYNFIDIKQADKFIKWNNCPTIKL